MPRLWVGLVKICLCADLRDWPSGQFVLPYVALKLIFGVLFVGWPRLAKAVVLAQRGHRWPRLLNVAHLGRSLPTYVVWTGQS